MAVSKKLKGIYFGFLKNRRYLLLTQYQNFKKKEI